MKEKETHDYSECKYCCDDVDMRDYLITDGLLGVYIDGGGFLTGDDELNFTDQKIIFCPHCGRKL